MTKYQMTLKSNRGVTWTETEPATLQYYDPIETDNKGHKNRIKLDQKT